MIDDDTGVCLTESPDIQYNLSGHSGKVLLNEYYHKTAQTASSPQVSMPGTWGSSTTSMRSGMVLTPCTLEFNYVLGTSHWFQVNTSH